MKKLVLLGALVAGLTFFTGTNSARADHCRSYGYSSYGYGYSPYSLGSFTRSYSSGYYGAYGRPYGGSSFSYYSPRFGITFGSSNRGFGYGRSYRSFRSHRGHRHHHHHHH